MKKCLNDLKNPCVVVDGRREQVCAYFRNQNLDDVTFDDSYKLRKECERIHAHIKDTVKFDVRVMLKGENTYD